MSAGSFALSAELSLHSHPECPLGWQGTAAQPSALDGICGAPQGIFGIPMQACPGICDCLPTAPRASGASPAALHGEG